MNLNDIVLNTGHNYRIYDKDFKIKVMKDIFENKLKPAEITQKYNIPTSCLYNWKSIYEKKGETGFNNKSRRPHTSPEQVPEHIEKEIVSAKNDNPLYGTKKIRDYLFRVKGIKLAVNTVHKILVKAGLKSAPECKDETARASDPQKQLAYDESEFNSNFEVERFERSNPNDLWQIDITTFYIRGLYRVYLIPILDDHSRFIVNFGLYREQREENVIITLKDAFVKYGLPKEILTDQGRQFTAWKGVTKFEKLLSKIGIYHTKSTAHHPQTCGKIESFNRNIKSELIDVYLFHSFENALERISAYIEHYNFCRPHQGNGGFTPADKYFGVVNEVKKYVQYLNQKNLKDDKITVGNKDGLYLFGKLFDSDIRVTTAAGCISIYINDKLVKTINFQSKDISNAAA